MKRRGGFVARMALCGLTILAVSGCRPLEFTVVFRDAKNLRTGDPLVYRGIQIGEVNHLELSGDTVRVQLMVYREHLTRVYREAEFVIEKQGGVLDTSGQMQLTMKDRGEARSQIQRADVLQGTEGMIDRMKEGATTLATDVLKRIVK